MKWKDRLLSSSLPLEYEVGRIITANEFYVDYDYSYKRHDRQLEKEFSIDIRAGGFYPFKRKSSIKINIDLLVECKYRNPSVSWLFIKDINFEGYSNFSSKGVIKVFDEFTDIFSKNSFTRMPFCETCLKGVEVNIQNGEVHDSGISHGINQLVYAMPPILYSRFAGMLSDHLNEVHPLILCPILVTTADLRILKNNFSIKSLEAAKTLDDISSEVPYLRFYSDVYPSFVEHCVQLFQNAPENIYEERLNYLEFLRKIPLDNNGYPDPTRLYTRPRDLLLYLREGIGNDIFHETMICNFNHFDELMREIKEAVAIVAKGFRKIKPPKAQKAKRVYHP